MYAGSLLSEGRIRPEAASVQAGRLGELQIRAGEIILGTPLLINKANIDRLDF